MRIARELFWWKSLENEIRFACQVITLGTWDYVLLAREDLGDEFFKSALENTPLGVVDTRSWNYWHLVYEISPVPPSPVRSFPPLLSKL
tara:strand:+ start:522 stop:788 length:267 start_codon:yes stop_codon:yes gene_type:complete